jgi:hypothetical protein
VTDANQPDLQLDVPHGARIWNYWLGGKDNYPADRAVGDAVKEAFPAIAESAVRSRQFLVRAVRYLAADAGIRQFLDVGTGLPTMQNTHEVAQAVAPDARVVYVDNDPLVLAHARALLVGATAEGATVYVDRDYREVEEILAAAGEVLDLDRPVGLLFMGVFGYVPDDAEVRRIIGRYVAGLPSGSYVALWDGTDTSEEVRAGVAAQAEMGSPYALRSVAEIEGWFDGLELVEPGVVPVTRWRPDPVEIGEPPAIDGYGGVARKP